MPEPASEAVRTRFKSQRVRDTNAELSVRKAVHGMGLRYRVDAKPETDLRVRADLLFTKARVAVFIDGCFWHGCPDHFIPPKNNAEWWATKIARNRERDQASRRELTNRGWIVLSIWEHEFPGDAASVIVTLVRARRD
jgi:DNA mismatch endonuclease (patch repair protein)